MEAIKNPFSSTQEITSRNGYRIMHFGNKVRIGHITALQQGEHTGPVVHLGQKVFSNGRFAVDKGTMGIVVGLEVPGEGGHTSNVIMVWFENLLTKSRMKFHDLEPTFFGKLEDLKYKKCL